MTGKSNDRVGDDKGLWKTWSLICIGEASRMGIAPLASSQLHVLLYLANTLASLFDIMRIRGRVLKRGEHPFYPDVQREVDKLAYSGVLSIEHVEYGPRGHLTAHYDIAHYGVHIFEELLAHSKEAQRTSKLFRELLSACFSKFLGSRAAIGTIDANYGNNDVLEGEVVDFSEWNDENKNIEVAEYLIEQLRTMRPHPERDGVRLYCDYLEKALAII